MVLIKRRSYNPYKQIFGYSWQTLLLFHFNIGYLNTIFIQIIIIKLMTLLITDIFFFFTQKAPLTQLKWFWKRSCIRSNWNSGEKGKPESPEKNLSEQCKEQRTNLTKIWAQVWNRNPRHIDERGVQSLLLPYIIIQNC